MRVGGQYHYTFKIFSRRSSAGKHNMNNEVGLQEMQVCNVNQRIYSVVLYELVKTI